MTQPELDFTANRTVPARGRVHYARLAESPRLQRLFALLGDGQWHGTRDIVHNAEVMAVNTAVTELRRNGYRIQCRCVGRGRYEYRLLADWQDDDGEMREPLPF